MRCAQIHTISTYQLSSREPHTDLARAQSPPLDLFAPLRLSSAERKKEFR